jgi:hypothetical protein
MTRRIRRSISVFVLLSMFVMTAGDGSHARPMRVNSPTPSSITSAADFLPQVRLRRLHLMRPDLIPYPIAYDAVC